MVNEKRQVHSYKLAGVVYVVFSINEDNLLQNAVVAELIKGYGLLNYMKVIPSVAATEDELCAFHSSSYISYLKTINEQYGPEDEVDLEYGLGMLTSMFKNIDGIVQGNMVLLHYIYTTTGNDICYYP